MHWVCGTGIIREVFRDSSQATTWELTKEFELETLKELNDEFQNVKIRVLSQGKRSVFDNVY